VGRRANTDHVVLADTWVACLHCGARQLAVPPGGISILEAARQWKLFAKSHTACKETPNSPKNRLEANEIEWEDGLHVGSSSATIFAVMVGRRPRHVAQDRIGAIPQDPDDFSRCHRLLRIKPEWRVRMVEVAQRFPAWAPLVEHWDELTRMFEAKDPGMFERMKSLGAAL